MNTKLWLAIIVGYLSLCPANAPALAVEIIQWTHADVLIKTTCHDNFACTEWAGIMLREYCDSHSRDKKWLNPDFLIAKGDRGFATLQECRDRWADELSKMPAVRLWNFPPNTPKQQEMVVHMYCSTAAKTESAAEVVWRQANCPKTGD